MDDAWIKQQLDAAGYDAPSGERWRIRECVELLLLQLKQQTYLTDSERLQAADIFVKLVNRHDIVPRDVQNMRGNWVQYVLGDFPPLSTVRVKRDAYDGDMGDRHNGMIGKLVAARGGRAIVQYADSAEGTGQRHLPDKLEVLIP